MDDFILQFAQCPVFPGNLASRSPLSVPQIYITLANQSIDGNEEMLV
jgi:hypothetical protein